MILTKFLVVGLGNPDEKYLNTYHNVGFNAVNHFAKTLNICFDKGECRALTAHTKTESAKVILAKPITYMNLSGESVRELVNKYKIEQPHCIIVYDDADLPLGKIKICRDGSGGSHNGMLNVIQNMGTQDIYRLRVGIGRPSEENMALMDYVLSKVSEQASLALNQAYITAAKALNDFCNGKPIDYLMLNYNHK